LICFLTDDLSRLKDSRMRGIFKKRNDRPFNIQAQKLIPAVRGERAPQAGRAKQMCEGRSRIICYVVAAFGPKHVTELCQGKVCCVCCVKVEKERERWTRIDRYRQIHLVVVICAQQKEYTNVIGA